MNYYSPDNNRQGKRAGIISVIVYAAVLLLLFTTMQFSVERKLSDGGILIDFGTTEDGMGGPGAMIAQRSAAPPPSTRQAADEMMTQDYEEAPEVRLPRPDQRRTQPPVREQTRREAVSEPDPEAMDVVQEVNPRALFPGRNPDSDATSGGDGQQAGNRGMPSGVDGGGGTGSGGISATGSGDHSFSLSGRRISGDFPLPAYPGKNKSGKVIIEIIVDGNGEVTSARYRASGSTTQDGELIGAARNAALKAKFTPDENNPVQTGTITYVFKLN